VEKRIGINLEGHQINLDISLSEIIPVSKRGYWQTLVWCYWMQVRKSESKQMFCRPDLCWVVSYTSAGHSRDFCATLVLENTAVAA